MAVRITGDFGGGSTACSSGNARDDGADAVTSYVRIDGDAAIPVATGKALDVSDGRGAAAIAGDPGRMDRLHPGDRGLRMSEASFAPVKRAVAESARTPGTPDCPVTKAGARCSRRIPKQEPHSLARRPRKAREPAHWPPQALWEENLGNVRCSLER